MAEKHRPRHIPCREHKCDDVVFRQRSLIDFNGNEIVLERTNNSGSPNANEKGQIYLEKKMGDSLCVFTLHTDPNYIPHCDSVAIAPIRGTEATLYIEAIYQGKNGNWETSKDPLTLLRDSSLSTEKQGQEPK